MAVCARAAAACTLMPVTNRALASQLEGEQESSSAASAIYDSLAVNTDPVLSNSPNVASDTHPR